MKENLVIDYDDFKECNFDKKEELEKFIGEEQKKFNKEKIKVRIRLLYKNYPFTLIIDSNGNMYFELNYECYTDFNSLIQEIEDLINRDRGYSR